MSVTVPATRYIKKKGDESGKYLILTRALTQALADGIFEEITEAEARAYDEKKEEVNKVVKQTNGLFLRRKGAKDKDPYWPWTEALAAHPDFEPYDPAPKKEEPVEVKEPNAPAPAPKDENTDPAGDVETPKAPGFNVLPPSDLTPEAKMPLIIGAIGQMNPDTDYTTPASKDIQPKPKCDVISAKLGFVVSAKERDQAFETYLTQQREEAERL